MRRLSGAGPLCAGIDPSGELLTQWGLRDDAVGLRSFCRTCVEAFAGMVGVVKAQVAFFERHGSAGMAELERLVAEASSAGLVVIADAKRGDIDSTAEAYADAWLNPTSPLAADAVTAHAYLGLGALAPLVRLAGAHGRGLLVVARSSNPEGRAPAAGAHGRRYRGRGHAPGRRSHVSTRPERSRREPWVRSSVPRCFLPTSNCPSSEA